MTRSLPVQAALEHLDDALSTRLPIRRIDSIARSKVQLFELPDRGGTQFAINVGDADPATGRFPLPWTRLYLERPLDGPIEGVEPCPDHVNRGSRLQQKDSRLPPAWQFPVEVDSLDGLARLLEWYTGAGAASPERSVTTDPAPRRDTTRLTPMRATNTILCGPPGTGKTYRTFRRAVELCDGPLPADMAETEIRRRYEALRTLGRVSFVTFHPSYGYEEFVEGLRPHATDRGQVAYDVLPGAFKRACEVAERRVETSAGIPATSIHDRTIFKISLGATWNTEGQVVFDYCLKNDCVLMGWGEDVDFTGCDDADAIAQRLAREMPDAEKPSSAVSFVDRFKNELKVGDLVVASLGNQLFRGIAEVTGEYEFAEDAPFHQMRAVRWLAVFEAGRPVQEIYGVGFSMQSLYRLNPSLIKPEAIAALTGTDGDAHEPADRTPRPHVLVIDEINRANISKVFGELITLIEPDKRKGEPNAITVRLPYSGEDFGVPANLHLLGTMNTADRSIALLDTALRRRFEFEEVMPDPQVLRGQAPGGVELEPLLARLNERIEVLYDRDHTIGHAYLIGVGTLEQLDAAFRTKLLPLLMEYFHDDASKVRRVLNDLGAGDFVERIVRAPVPADGDEDGDDDPAVVYRINRRPFPVEAYRRIYGGA